MHSNACYKTVLTDCFIATVRYAGWEICFGALPDQGTILQNQGDQQMKRIILLAAVVAAVSLIFNQLVSQESAAAATPAVTEQNLTDDSLHPVGSTSISEIVEITNKTKDTYFMYVWDNEHEGRYTPYNRDNWYYPDEGKWLEIKPGAHIRADDCGLPDGGKTAGKDRVRVIFKAKPGQRTGKGDPNRGLRMNRVGTGSNNDSIVFRNHGTGEDLSQTKIPARMHQSLLLIIDENGARFQETDRAVSGEAQLQDAMKTVGKAFELGAKVFLEVMNKLP
jgi:hypothetical protein